VTYPTPPQPPRARRPWTIRVVSYLLLLAVAVLLLQLAAYVYDLTAFGAVVDRAGRAVRASPADLDAATSASNISDAVALAVLLLCVLALLAGTAGIRRASPGGRVLSLVGCAVLLTCCTGVSVSNVVLAAPTSALDREITRLQDASYPYWVTVADYAGLLLYPLLLLAFVLLLLPASNRYFRPAGPIYLLPLD